MDTKLKLVTVSFRFRKRAVLPGRFTGVLAPTIKVHITPLTKFRPETPYGVKTLHVKYFQNRNCGFPII